MRVGVKWMLLTLMFATGAAMQTATARAEDTIPVLVYHRFGPVATELTTVRTETLATELAWLHANSIAVLPLHEVVERLKASTAPAPAAVVLTADDGNESIYTDMFPLIRHYHMQVTLFVYPSAISNSKSALSWEQLTDMQKSGLIDVQSHTYWHPDFRVEKNRLDAREYEKFVRNQLQLSKSRLQDHLRTTVDLLAWPFGLFDRQLEGWAAEEGYVAAFGIERRRLRRGDDLYALPRFEVTDADRGARFAALVLGHSGSGARQ